MVPLLVLPAAGLMEKAASIAACWSLLSSSGLVPLASRALTVLVTSVAVGRSVRSRSAKAIEPLSLRVVPSVMSPTTRVGVSTGPSLAPLMVTVMS